MFEDDSVVKIPIAAERMGVSVKTIYNWLSKGTIVLVHPGFVRMGDVIRAHNLAERERSIESSRRMGKVYRDRRGRFLFFGDEIDLVD